jgi:spore maturation protein CgeB
VNIFVFASSLVSSYWNGAATYYRGLYKNLNALGHEITFAEPDIYERQRKRDEHDFSYVRTIVYQTPRDIPRLLADAAECDLVIKHSGIGADDALLEREVLACRSERTRTEVAWWDVDAPATLARVEADGNDPLRECIPQYDYVFTYGGGPRVIEHYLRLGAKNCRPVYNAVDPETHYPVAADQGLQCDMALVANRLPDRERRVEQFFFAAAELEPQMTFVLGGEGWSGKPMPANVRWIGHVATADHNRVNCSARMVLNINRESMANVGFSPPTRVFEAAGAGACLITDAWDGIDSFFTPGSEILIAATAHDIVRHLREHDADACAEIGRRMRARALAEHTYALRAKEVHDVLTTSKAAIAA